MRILIQGSLKISSSILICWILKIINQLFYGTYPMRYNLSIQL